MECVVLFYDGVTHGSHNKLKNEDDVVFYLQLNPQELTQTTAQNQSQASNVLRK